MHKIGTPLLLAASAFAVFSFVPFDFFAVEYNSAGSFNEDSQEEVASDSETNKDEEDVVDERPVIQHVPLPESVKAIYMTSCVAGTPSFRSRLIDLMQETEINSVVIDIKDYSGTISFAPESEEWKSAWYDSRCGARDMKNLISLLHDHDIFVIGRITVFQDPFYAIRNPDQAVLRSDQETVWKDHKGLSFVDVASQEFWDHIVELSIDSYNLGFDELNFDYVRYPSDGNMQDTYYPQSEAGEYGMDRQANLEAFFQYLKEKMDDESLFADFKHANTGKASSTPYTSADLFGMTTTNYDDLSIGQIQERAVPYFDYIAPMVYPSHYPNGFLNLGNPNDYPYRVVNHAMQAGVNRLTASTTRLEGFLHEPIYTTNASGTRQFTGLYEKPVYGPDKFRTWIQDFDYGGDYDADDVRAQIQASYDAGVESWMIWSPGNVYTRAALHPAQEVGSSQSEE